MNLNPLKKEDNTDALVKALEDAGAGDQAATGQPVNSQPPIATTDPANPVAAASMPPADPQQPVDMPDVANAGNMPAAASSADNTLPQDDSTVNTSASLSFNGSNLPAGLSGDADAHLPSEGSGENSEIDGVKKSALEQLRPLIEKLDLEPADKFDKYLMMLRASDDPALIKPAFDAAQGISGEKEKAQALLDIINEINYITASQQQDSSTS